MSAGGEYLLCGACRGAGMVVVAGRPEPVQTCPRCGGGGVAVLRTADIDEPDAPEWDALCAELDLLDIDPGIAEAVRELLLCAWQSAERLHREETP